MTAPRRGTRAYPNINVADGQQDLLREAQTSQWRPDQQQLIQHHDKTIQNLRLQLEALETLQRRTSTLRSPLPVPSRTSPSALPGPRSLPPPVAPKLPKFAGRAKEDPEIFMSRLERYFNACGVHPDDQEEIAAEQLQEEAKKWYRVYTNMGYTFLDFSKRFREQYCSPVARAKLAETQLLHDELRQEKLAKERLLREKEAVTTEKYVTESALADARLESELKDEKLLMLRCKLDELVGQVQLLEQAKLRLEMTLESQRKESKRETQQRDEELEEVRRNSQEKVKALEVQLENEHEERTLLLRENHELERRLAVFAESNRNERAGDEALVQRLKRDLERTKVLLRDAQVQLERQKVDNPSKILIRQLRNQIEDLECSRAVANKAKQSIDIELAETQASLEEAHKARREVEDKANGLSRERSDLQAQLEENEEELAEVVKKYKAVIQQMSSDQLILQVQASLVSELEGERNSLKDQLVELTTKLESAESLGDASSNLLAKRMELKTKELESKLELEQTTRSSLEVQIARLKEAVDKLQNDLAGSKVKEQQAQEQTKKSQRRFQGKHSLVTILAFQVPGTRTSNVHPPRSSRTFARRRVTTNEPTWTVATPYSPAQEPLTSVTSSSPEKPLADSALDQPGWNPTRSKRRSPNHKHLISLSKTRRRPSSRKRGRILPTRSRQTTIAARRLFKESRRWKTF